MEKVVIYAIIAVIIIANVGWVIWEIVNFFRDMFEGIHDMFSEGKRIKNVDILDPIEEIEDIPEDHEIMNADDVWNFMNGLKSCSSSRCSIDCYDPQEVKDFLYVVWNAYGAFEFSYLDLKPRMEKSDYRSAYNKLVRWLSNSKYHSNGEYFTHGYINYKGYDIDEVDEFIERIYADFKTIAPYAVEGRQKLAPREITYY